MFLLGSRALAHLSRMEAHDDWDVLLSENEMFFSFNHPLYYASGMRYQGSFNHISIDAIVVMNNKNCVMNRLYKALSLQSIKPIDTAIGSLKILPLDVHKSLLLAIPEHERTTKQTDYLKCMAPIRENQDILCQLKQNYQQISTKNNFFDGYRKPRYVPHDRIHWWISEALGLAEPTYLSIMVSPVAVCADRFAALSLARKYSLLCEEAIVLAVERYLIKSAAETSIDLGLLWQSFYNVCDPENPVKRRIQELCTVGVIADHPDWLASWGEKHFFEMMPHFKKYLRICQKYMPQSFFDYILYLRTTRLSKAA